MNRALALALLSLAVAAPAMASPCDDPASGSPLLVSRPPGNLGTVPDACPGTGASLVSGAAVLIDRPDFYGSIWAGSGLAGRVQLTDSIWLSTVAPGFEYRFVANAVVEATHTGVGGGNLAVHRGWEVSENAVVAPFARVLFPTETVYRRARRYGGELGAASTWRPSRQFELAGGVSVPALVTVNGTYRDTLVQPVASGDVFWHATSSGSLALAAGAALRFNAGADRDTFEALELRTGARARPWRGAVAEVALSAPRYGRDRTDLAVTLSLGWTFDRPSIRLRPSPFASSPSISVR